MPINTTPLPGDRPIPGATGAILAPPAEAAEDAPPDAVEPDAVEPTAAGRPAWLAWPWERIGLVAIVLLSGTLELWRLDQLGYGNQFYAAAVLSMLQSWHNFFFASFDPAGFVSIDKPPVGFWFQVLSAKLLGFSGFSILLPEALATVGSVVLLYHLIKRAFGAGPGLLAGLMLALTPVTVVTGRNNTIDSLLVFALLLAAWTAILAAERGQLRWLLATGVIVGIGFAIKMMEAYLVVPALGLLYLLAAPRSLRVRIGHLGLATLVLLGVSFAWPLAVDATPANARPWVDSTQDNSAVTLALGYNGLERLLGRNRSVDQFINQLGSAVTSPGQAVGPGFGGGPGGFGETGAPGPQRLIDQQLGGQASWLLPLALLGAALFAVRAWNRRHALSTDRKAQAGILWGTWLLSTGTFFSVAGYFHTYYLVTFAPPVAALAAMGVVGGWSVYKARRWLGWLLPATLVATALVEARILGYVPTVDSWLTPTALAGAGLGAAILLAYWLGLQPARASARLVVARGAASLAVVALLVAPGAWAQMSLARAGGGLPAAGPQVRGGFGVFGGFAGRGRAFADGAPPVADGGRRGDGFGFGQPAPGIPGPSAGQGGPAAANDGARGRVAPGGAPPGPGTGGGPGGGSGQSSLVDYLVANQGNAKFLAATTSSNGAAPIILATSRPVMAIGGFLGGDPTLTVDQFAALVQNGTVRFFLGGGFGGFGRGGGDASAIASWVQTNCAPVQVVSGGGPQGSLYDCAPAAGANG